MDITAVFHQVIDHAVRRHCPETATSELRYLRERCSLTYSLMAEMVKTELQQASSQGIEAYYAALNDLKKFINAAPYLVAVTEADLRQYAALDPHLKQFLEHLYHQNPETFEETFASLVNGLAETTAKDRTSSLLQKIENVGESAKWGWRKTTGVGLGAVAVGGTLLYLWNKHHQNTPDPSTSWTERIQSAQCAPYPVNQSR